MKTPDVPGGSDGLNPDDCLIIRDSDLPSTSLPFQPANQLLAQPDALVLQKRHQEALSRLCSERLGQNYWICMVIGALLFALGLFWYLRVLEDGQSTLLGLFGPATFALGPAVLGVWLNGLLYVYRIERPADREVYGGRMR